MSAPVDCGIEMVRGTEGYLWADEDGSMLGLPNDSL